MKTKYIFCQTMEKIEQRRKLHYLLDESFFLGHTDLTPNFIYDYF